MWKYVHCIHGDVCDEGLNEHLHPSWVPSTSIRTTYPIFALLDISTFPFLFYLSQIDGRPKYLPRSYVRVIWNASSIVCLAFSSTLTLNTTHDLCVFMCYPNTWQYAVIMPLRRVTFATVPHIKKSGSSKRASGVSPETTASVIVLSTDGLSLPNLHAWENIFHEDEHVWGYGIPLIQPPWWFNHVCFLPIHANYLLDWWNTSVNPPDEFIIKLISFQDFHEEVPFDTIINVFHILLYGVVHPLRVATGLEVVEYFMCHQYVILYHACYHKTTQNRGYKVW